MSIIDRLSEYFAHFPGIGERQARRFVYFLLRAENGYVKDFLESIVALKKNVARCKSCFRFFESADKELCALCASSATDQSLLMVMEKDSDLENFAQSGTYRGRFFILGGLVPITEKDTEKKVRAKELLAAAQSAAASGLKEIILAFAASPQGEHTESYLRKILAPLSIKHGLKISSLGRGLSTGAELEYTDPDTLKNALKNRS
ncbi:hypothetical protein A3I25_02555 [Candidatus Nomurabacteria bacterium RIFCSPLOWO2_02_FULL_42_17]|uniref:Recombination protein RecR n=2 Tax=Candidatus Nomuraibacteriota TaxID=1752729 RepID=A0A1F6WLH8_9BACT|nr:MAG: Recombination protein RecR [Parcubacteria group bacterium GW2011_GWA2_42_18]OGI82730.1 MAG: hypothetical protein A3B93_02510 [Candidatus Nomurabacteria bacterium RIFCSPHIGHO2_02_FULL_42_24]OGI97793.1 MAG: hypothetical protein A3I25_02555 [Candidatus Nomurabacteria bacterium RIFCSPLOWO2_02_FULL_42_17]